jgi:hypothetical protein
MAFDSHTYVVPTHVLGHVNVMLTGDRVVKIVKYKQYMYKSELSREKEYSERGTYTV